MASVWVARLTGKHGFEKLLAVKTILPHFAQDPRFRTMFLDEARVASRIEHPNVAQVLDLGEVNDVLYLVMEWVDGDSLSKLYRTVQKRGDEVPMGVLLRVLADACAGLHAAHEVTGEDGEMLGVVHRDVSPQNILVTAKGAAKLIDFGVVKARGRVAAETSSGQLKGKIHYMAPEQAVGMAVDRRADIWSVAAVGYYFLAGVPPFDGPNELATLHLVTSGFPPPPLPPYVPAPIASVILGALVSNADHRQPQTALEMHLALEDAMRRTGHQTSIADVAAFASRYLGGRSEARKKALDTALVAAAERKRMQDILKPLGAIEGESSSGVGSSPMASARMHGVLPTPPTPVDVDIAFDSEEMESVSQSVSSAASAMSRIDASDASVASIASQVRPALLSFDVSPTRGAKWRGAVLGGVVLLVLAVAIAGLALWVRARDAVTAVAPAASAAPPPVAESAPPPAVPAAAPPSTEPPAANTSANANANANVPAVAPPVAKAAAPQQGVARPAPRPRPAPAPGHKTDYGF
jgi:serine/threonine protein kinase